jgi:type IV secretory pathway VirD2 relaxase
MIDMSSRADPGTPAYRALPLEVRAAYEEYMRRLAGMDRAQDNLVAAVAGHMEPLRDDVRKAIHRARSLHAAAERLAASAYDVWKAAEARHPAAPRIRADYSALPVTR